MLNTNLYMCNNVRICGRRYIYLIDKMTLLISLEVIQGSLLDKYL